MFMIRITMGNKVSKIEKSLTIKNFKLRTNFLTY